MARFNDLLKKAARFNRLQPLVALDFGSVITKLRVGDRVVWHQPTVVAWHTREQTVMAIGDKAYQLAGKTPHTIKLIFPVRDGVVADVFMATTYLETLFQTLRKQELVKAWLSPQCVVALPAGASPVERQFLERVIHQAGFFVGALVSKPAAIVSHHQRSLDQTVGCIDIGAHTIELGLFTGGEPVALHTVRGFGSDRWVHIVQQLVKTAHNCDIGWQAAEKLITQIGTVSNVMEKDAPVMVVRGRDMHHGSVASVRISAALFVEPLQQAVHEMLSEVQLFLGAAPADVVTQALTQGLYLAGGGARLKGIAQMIGSQLNTECVLAAAPELEVVLGLRK
jgi:rod shape-determining protein MreB and related proteins